MRDEEYLFKEDVREKAITARSAKKRPRHSGCRLPQYTAKEMREMSGPTYTLNLKKTYHIRRVQSTSRGLAEELRAEHYRQVPRRAFGSCRAYGRERRCGRRLPEQERLFLQARFSAYEGRPREIPRGLWYQHECADKKNNFGELLVLLLRGLQCGELCKANQGLRPRRTTPAGLRSSRGSRARALCY